MLRIDDIPQQVADDIHAFGVIGTRDCGKFLNHFAKYDRKMRVRKRLLRVSRNKGCGDFVEGAIMGKAPLCKGSSCEAGEGLCRFEKLAGKDRARFLDNPSVIFSRKCHLL